MELINWSLSAIDKIFSLKRASPGEPTCPSGTFAAGYARDSWENWQAVCLDVLSVEDIEDLWIIGILIVGFLITGLGISLMYRKIGKTAATKFYPKLSGELKECLNEVNEKLKVLHQRADQNGELTRELTRNTSDRSVEAQRRIDTIGAQSGELLRVTTGLTMKVEGLSKSLNELDARMALMRREIGHNERRS